MIDNIERTFFDHVARGVPDGSDDGTLAPWAVADSWPFASEIMLPTVLNFRRLKFEIGNPSSFKASIDPLCSEPNHGGVGSISKYPFGLNEGPTVLMIENYRSGLI